MSEHFQKPKADKKDRTNTGLHFESTRHLTEPWGFERGPTFGLRLESSEITKDVEYAEGAACAYTPCLSEDSEILSGTDEFECQRRWQEPTEIGGYVSHREQWL